MDNLNVLIGLTVVAVKGHIGDDKRYNPARLGLAGNADWIFFDDGRTFIELEQQDGYTYHDADWRARVLNIHQDENEYRNLMSWKDVVDVKF